MQLVSPEGCTGQGLVSVVMTVPAQHRDYNASKLQVGRHACNPPGLTKADILARQLILPMHYADQSVVLPCC